MMAHHDNAQMSKSSLMKMSMTDENISVRITPPMPPMQTLNDGSYEKHDYERSEKTGETVYFDAQITIPNENTASNGRYPTTWALLVIQ